MSWINWVYLGAGLGLGLGSNWLLGWLKEPRENEVISPSGFITHAVPNYKQQVLDLSKQLQQTQMAYQMAHQMSQFKAGFLVRAAHELRSPLNSLIGLHQLILSDLCDDSAEEREFVAQAYESALKLIKLMDEILDVARIEQGTNQLEIQPLPLAHMLQEVYNLTHLLAANRNFPFQLSPPEPEIYILADPRWLRQVLVNLVDTCIAQMEEGTICVSAQPRQGDGVVHIWLDVELPISAWSEPVDLMQSEHKFIKPLSQGNPALSPGLMLLLNQTLLELMNGCLQVLPVPGDTDTSHVMRLQVTIPLVIPETAFLEQEEN